MHEHHHLHHDTGAARSRLDETQAVCAVTGDIVVKAEAEELGHVRNYESKAYYFCCPTCVQLFDKNPKKYSDAAHEANNLTLVEKEHLVDSVWAFRFTAGEQLSWIPGQFVRVELDHPQPDKEGTKRWFTVSSAPYEGIVQITTRITDSTFKKALGALPIGGHVRLLEEPSGDFVWQDSNRSLIFVAGGIGVTPFYSMLKQRSHDRASLDATLIYASRTDDIPFRDELDRWAASSGLDVRYVIGTHLTVDVLKGLVPEVNDSLVYVSGPEPIVETLGGQLTDAGLPKEQLKQDFFPNYDETNY